MLVGRRFIKRFEILQAWEDRLVPHVQKKLKLCSVVHASHGEFGVTRGKPNFIVRLRDKFYDCQSDNLLDYLANWL